MTGPDRSRTAGIASDAPRRLTLISIGVAGLALVVGLVVSFFSYGPGWPIVSPRGSTVASFSGDSDLTTESFRVREGWRIQWESTGATFAMGIDGDLNMGTVVSVEGPETGLTAPPSKGTFHLEIRASGPWTATILQGR